jgi:hypothetical protein
MMNDQSNRRSPQPARRFFSLMFRAQLSSDPHRNLVAMKTGKFILFFVLLTVFGLMLAGCSLGQAQAGRRPSPDFSRGMPVSDNVAGTSDMLVNQATGAIHFVWSTAADDQAHVHYLQLNEAAEIVADFDLDLPEARHRAPRLLSANDDLLHLFWGLRSAGSKSWELWHVPLDQAGILSAQPGRISPEDMRVGDYIVVQNNSGDALVIWEQESSKGLWAIRVGTDGIEPDPVRLTESGEAPGAYLEEDGTLHLTWLEERNIQYASFPGGELSLTEGQTVADLGNITANVDDPVVGVAGDWVYIMWSLFALSGLESGTGWTEYIAFPKEETSRVAPARIWMLTDEEQAYDPYSGAYALTVQVPAVTSPALSSNYIVEPDIASGQENELAVAISSKQLFRLDELVQIAVLLFRDGEYTGYQMAGKTEAFSMDGTLQSDEAGQLYLAWREGTGRQLYFASTEPGLRDALNQLGQADMFQVIVGGGLEAVTGVLFFPLSMIWFIPGGLLLVIYKLRKDDETVNDTASVVFLIIAILLYQTTKLLFLPSITSYVPFSAWLDVPRGIGLMLQIMVPLLSFGLGILVAEWVRRRRSGMSSLLYFFIACGVDAIITLMIYGVNLLGVI